MRSQRKLTGTGPRIASLLLAILATLTLASALYTVGWGQNPFDAEDVHGPTAADVDEVLNPSESFPQQVAVVDGQPIHGIDLSRRIEILRTGHVAGDLKQIALDQLIDFEVLVQAGINAGLEPNDDEIKQYLQDLQVQLDAIPAGSSEREGMVALAAGFGYDLNSIADSPPSIEWARRTLTAMRMRQQIVAGLPDKGNPAAEKNAVVAFVDAFRLSGSVEITLPTLSP